MSIYQRSGALKADGVIILLAGIWAIISAYALTSGAGAAWSGTIVGILMIICSIGRMQAPAARGFSVANIIWSIWLIISPWVLRMPGAAIHWSNAITGIVALIAAVAAVRSVPAVVAFPQSGGGPSQRAA